MLLVIINHIFNIFNQSLFSVLFIILKLYQWKLLGKLHIIITYLTYLLIIPNLVYSPGYITKIEYYNIL